MADPINLDAVFQAARGAQAPSAPTGQEQPDLTKELDRIIGGAGGQTSAPNQAVKDPLSDFVDSLPVQAPAPFTPTKGYGQAFMDAVHRGARQVQATPEHLKGIYASTQGDKEGQARAAEAAAEIQGRAPEAVTSFQDALESEGFERLNYWLVEKLGEQLPILAGSAATGGAGGVAGALVGRGLLSTTAARALAARGGMAAGAFAGGTALETAGTGEEQYQATGDYNAGVSIAAGVAKGALEFITPYKLISRVGRGAPLTAGGTLPGAILKTAATEGLTEGLQEEIDIAARKYSDPSYDYFGSEANWRRLESAAAGFAVGGVYGGAGEALGRRRDQKAGSQTTLTNEEAQNYVGTSPINWLYKFAEKEKKGGLDKDIGDTLKAADSPDVYGVNSLIGTIGKGYNLLSPAQQEELAAYKEDSIPRYAIQRPDGGFENKFYTRTEWERWRAENAPTGDLSGYKFMKVKPESLRPVAITALGTDLPAPNSGRIYFLPGTTSEEKAQLMKGYADLYSWSNPLSAMEAGKLPEARQAQYNQLLSGGLRVLPARGAGYHYTDTFDGDYVDEPTATDRSYAVGILDGNQLSHPWRNTEMGQPTGSMNPFNGRVVAVDFAKLKMGDWSYIPTNQTKAYTKEELAKRAHFADHVTPERRDEMLEWAAAFNKGFVESTAEGKDAKYYFDKMREFLDEGMSFPYEMEVNTVEQPFQLQFSKNANLKRALIPGVNIQRGAENFRDFLSRTKEGTGEWVDKTEGQEPSLFGVSQAKYTSAKQLLAHFRIFSFRLMTEMKLPPVTIEVAWSPESGRSSQAEYSPASSTIFVYLSKIHTFEPIDFEAAVLRTAIHELGHHITLHGWKQLPSGTKTRIWAEYNRYLLALRLKNPAVNLGSALMPMTETGMVPQKNVNANYFLSFPEYLAEQMTRLLTSPKVKAITPIEEFYLKTQTQLNKLEERATKYSAWKDYVYSNDPHYEFTKLYEHLVTTGRGERSSPALRMNLQPRVFQNPAVERISQVIQETFEEMKGMLPAEVQLEITQNPEKYGSYRSEPSTIAVSVHAVEAVNGIKGTLAHEGIHASWELFTESEKVILIEGAKEVKSLQPDEVRAYRHYYNLQAKDLGLDNLEAHQYVQAKLDEEYVAALVQQRIGGKVVQGPLGELVDRIYQFLVRVVNKLKGLGYQNLDDILQAFYVGEMASRSELLADKNAYIEQQAALYAALRGFYSLATRKVEEAKQEIATKQQWRALLKDVPQDELNWMGFDLWLEEQGDKVKKSDILTFFENEKVELEEVEKKGIAPYSQDDVDILDGFVSSLADSKDYWTPTDVQEILNEIPEHEEGNGPAIPVDKLAHDVVFQGGKLLPWKDALIRGKDKLRELQAEINKAGKFTDYTNRAFQNNKAPPENYRELLFRFPEIANKYNSKHFQDYELSHLRFEDEIGPGGGKQLTMIENQSDLHQTGAEYGYDNLKVGYDKEAVDASAKLVTELKARLYSLEGLPSDEQMRVKDTITYYIDEASGTEERWAKVLAFTPSTDFSPTVQEFSIYGPHGKRIAKEITFEEREILRKGVEANKQRIARMRRVADAPFKGEYWEELGWKRGLQLAVDEGYDTFSWYTPEEVATSVGVKAEKVEPFYIKRAQKFLNKYVKQWGGKVEVDPTKQTGKYQRFYIKITPEIREGIKAGIPYQGIYRKSPALRVGAERWSTFKPDAIVKLDEQNYVAREISHDVKGERVINFRYYGPPKDGAIGADVRSALEELGDEKGYVLISEKKDKGWEVDYITVNPQYLGQRYGDFMYKYIEESLETKMKPSGVLTADGYKNWKKRDPSWVRYHVWSAKDEMWYSPNFIKARKTTWLNIEKRGAAPADATAENVAKWRELYNKVPKKAWRDPQLEEMFHLSRKALQHGVAESIIAGENQAQESEFLTAAQQAGMYDGEVSQKESGFHPGELNLEGSSDPKLVGPEFQPILEMIGKVGEDNPEVRKYLHGIVKAGDKNTGFSRLFLGLHQLTWNNAHIPKMREYLSQVEAWSAQKAKWISRADGVAKKWDKLRDNKQKEELAEFLFWLTEMSYRSPAEVKAKVRRQPTAPEFNREVAKRGLNAETLGVYMEIKASFDELLLQIEQIGVQNITQMFAKNPAGLQAQLADFQKEMASLRSRPYFPMVRFGQWTITARDPNRKVLGFYTYPTIRERDAAVRQVALAHPASDIQIGRMPEEVQEFMGLPAPVLRLIRAKLPGITQTQNDWLEQLENQLAPERSFKKRWLERKGTPGYSMDAMRAYSHYFQSASDYMARLMYKDQMQKTIDSLRQESERTLASMDKRRKLIDYMQKHLNYIMEGGRDWAKVKSVIAMFYLGFSPMAAGMNLTQIPTMVLPYLSSRYGNRATLGAMSWASTALKGAVAGQLRNPPTPGYELARQELISQGKIDAGQAPELGAYANSSNLNRLSAGDAAQKAMRQTSMAAMWMFQQTERFNRELTFAMTYKLVQNNPNTKFLQDLSNTYIVEIADIQTRTGMSFNDALTVIAARESIDRTQFIYSPWARPPFMRGNMTGVVLAFFQYLQSAIYASWYNPGAVKIWLVMLFMYGLMGLPGAEDVDELVTAVARRMFGTDFSLKREARKYVREVTRGTLFDKTGPDLFLHGISKFGFGVGLLPDSFGAPKFDASANGSLGKIIPGLAHGANLYGTYSEWDKILAKMTQDSAGAGFGYMFTMMKFLSASPRSAEQREWEAIMPRALKAASKAQRYWTTGKETNPAGAAIATFDKNDPQDRATMIAQFLGATPMKVSSKWEALSELSDIGEYYKGRRLDLYNQLDDALRSGDPKALNDMLAAINRYNQELVKNDLGELAIKAQQAIGSLKNRARSRAMTEAGLPNQKALIPTYQRGQDLYPGVEFSVKVK